MRITIFIKYLLCSTQVHTSHISTDVTIIRPVTVCGQRHVLTLELRFSISRVTVYSVVNKNLVMDSWNICLDNIFPSIHSPIQQEFFENSFGLLTSFVSFSITLPITLLHPMVNQTDFKKRINGLIYFLILKFVLFVYMLHHRYNYCKSILSM